MATGSQDLNSQNGGECFLSDCMEPVNDDDDAMSINLDDSMIDDDASSVFSNDDERNLDESGSVDMWAKPSGNVRRRAKPGQVSVKMNCDIVKFIQSRKKFSEELGKYVSKLNAEMQLIPDKSCIKITKKPESRNIKDWKKKCVASVLRFCRRFGKDCFPLDEETQDTVRKALPKLGNKLRSTTAHYWIEADNKTLSVMSEKSERDEVLKKVREFLNISEDGFQECRRKSRSDESNWRKTRKPSKNETTEKMVTVGEPQSNAFNFLNDEENKPENSSEISGDVSNEDPAKQFQKFVKIDNDIIKFLTKRKKHSGELREQLSSFGAQLAQLNYVAGEIRLKKIDSAQVEDWEKRCEDTVRVYCRQFHKKHFQIGGSIQDSISEGLPTVQKTVSSSGAACWLDKPKQNLIVVCLKRHQSDIMKAVKEFIEKVGIFAKKCFQIEAPVRALVEKSLPTLKEELPSCQVTFEKQTLAVVCLRNEIDNVALKVEGFLQGIKIGNERLRIQKLNSNVKGPPPLMQVHTSSFHDESGASAVNWRNRSGANPFSSQSGGTQFVARGRPNKLQPLSVKMNKDLIKFVMNNERFTKELTNQLEKSNGGIEWKFGIGFITVVQKSEEVFVPNWSEQCKSLVTKFFQRFGNQSYEIREEIKDSVRNGLTSVKDSISSLGADCWLASNNRWLVLVSLKENLPSVLKIVEAFLQKIKEENEKPQDIVMFVNVSSDHIDYLEHTQFLETVKQSRPGITEATAVKNGTWNQIRFVGPHEQVSAAKQQCDEMVKELIVTVLELPTEAMNFVSKRAGLEFFEKCLSDRDIVSVLLVEPKSSVKIVAKSVEEYEKVRECFSNNVRKVLIPLPSRNEHIFTSRKWDEISKTIKTEELVDFQINFENGKKRDITLHGAAYLVQKYNKVIQDFIDSQKIESPVMYLPTGIARYLKEKLSAEVEIIKAELREEQVKIEIGSGRINFEGTKVGVDQSKRRIMLLRGEIVPKSKDFSSIGVNSLFSSKDGQRNIKGIEAGFNVVIEVTRVFAQPESIGATQAQSQAVRQEPAHNTTDHEMMDGSSVPTDPFDQCNFTTREGLQVSWKYGNIAQERADILVNSATSDLNSPTMVGRVLNSVGGPSFIAVCSQHTRIGIGEIATTIGGNLPCNYVIHAVCCGWNHSGKSERILCSLLLKILLECARKKARSVAMPLIGTGKHKFPENVVLRVMREQFERFSSMLPSGTLKEIKLVRYDQGKRRPARAVQVAAVYGAARAVPIAKPRSSFVPLEAGSGEEDVTLQVYGRAGDDIDSALLEIGNFIASHITSQKVEDNSAFEVANKNWGELKRLASDGLRIKCIDAKTVSIEGLTSKVLEVKDRLTELVSRFTEEERRSNQLGYISQNVQWYYNDPSNGEVAYNATLNGEIEVARMEGKATVEITDPDGHQYDVDFNQMVARNKINGQTKKLTRKLIGSGSDLSLPSNWAPQQPGQVVQLVQLQRYSSEYMDVLQHFTSRGGQANRLYKVERIQNPRLYSAFLAVKKSMRNPNEMRLFHGTEADNIESINANNFSRSYAGAHATAFGNGVYFARDASYSMQFAKPNHFGSHAKMYMAKVLVGDYTKGLKGMKAPPSKNDPSNPGVRYDSVVNNPLSPTMYIIFQDNQCYPEYLLTLNL